MDERVLSRMDAPALREYIRCMAEKKKGKPRTDKELDEADDEREALSDLHDETSGKAAGVPVEIDNELPPELDTGEEADDEEPDDDMDDEEGGKKPPFPPKKKKGKA